jgi:hypothetical protein
MDRDTIHQRVLRTDLAVAPKATGMRRQPFSAFATSGNVTA